MKGQSSLRPADHDRSEVDGLFGPGSVTWRVHGDTSMVAAGFRALMLQALHPLAMAGLDDNSSFKQDPWGRLERTRRWTSTVTYGTRTDAEHAGRRLRRLHASLPTGVEPETGLPYRVDDPALLRWVHVTEVESFLTTYRRSGGRLLPGEADRYVDEMRASAELVGLDRSDVPATEADIADYYAGIRPELRLTAVARRNVAWGFAPPMPRWVRWATPARPAWAGVVALAMGMLPPWARRLYGLPGLPTTDVLASVNGRALRRTLNLLPLALTGDPAYAEALRRTRGAAAA